MQYFESYWSETQSMLLISDGSIDDSDLSSGSEPSDTSSVVVIEVALLLFFLDEKSAGVFCSGIG